jgi:TetR/AcrR family tetracycline transcriptional repressor
MPYPRRTDRASIVSAAIELMDSSGLDGISLRAIATRLGIRQPGLYHHFASKAELLDAVADEILDRWHTDRLPADGERWDEFVARNARSLRRAMLSIRDGARLIASAGSRSPGLDNAIVQTALLEAAGFSGTDAILALIAVSRYTIGSAIEQQTARDGGDIVIPATRTDTAAVSLIAAAQRVVALGQDHQFETGLAALLRGLAPVLTPGRGLAAGPGQRGAGGGGAGRGQVDGV